MNLAATQFIVGPAGRLDHGDGHEPYVRVEKGQFGCVIFGPYTVFEPGEYDVAFEIAVDDRFISEGQNFCRVDVASDFGNRIIREIMVNSNYIDGKGVAQVALRFVIEESLPLEFRLYSLGTQTFSVKYEREVRLVRSFRILRLVQKWRKARGLGRGLGGVLIGKFYMLLVRSFRRLRMLQKWIKVRVLASGPMNAFYTDNFDRFQRYTYLGANVTPSRRGVVMDWMGVKLHIKHQEDFHIITEVFRLNNYNFVNRGAACVIDVGMNVGIASLYFARMPQVSVVHSFEPFSWPFARALENFALNPELSSKIRPNRVGLAAKSEVTRVRCSESTIGTSIRGNDGPDEDNISIQEASEALKPIFDEASHSGQAIVLKMDCEGSEFTILDSLHRSNLLVNVKILMMEWHKWWSPPEKTNQNIVEILSQDGFVIFDFAHLDDPHASMIYAVRQ